MGKNRSSSLVVHFLYGSTPNNGFRKTEKKVLGGRWGGHVYLQLDNFVYGFEPVNYKKLHIFPHKPYNSVFKKEELDDWEPSIETKKVTKIIIPLKPRKKQFLEDLFESYIKKTPYDYAVFGMRCGASSYQILALAGLFRWHSKIISAVLVPYPRPLRKWIIRMAKKRNHDVSFTEGNGRRKWEKG